MPRHRAHPSPQLAFQRGGLGGNRGVTHGHREPAHSSLAHPAPQEWPAATRSLGAGGVSAHSGGGGGH